MKRLFTLLVVVLFMTGLMSVAAFADDDVTNYQFTFTAGTTRGTTADYGYSSNFKQKLSNKTYIEVRHTVTESAAGFTNLIAAGLESGSFTGSKWMSPNGSYYMTNGGCTTSTKYAPCGRGNTKYYEQNGLTRITITGQFRVH